jgi:hypothetical protein
MPASIPTRIWFRSSMDELPPLDLQINYVAAYMVAKAHDDHVYGYEALQHFAEVLELEALTTLSEMAPSAVFTGYISTPFAIFLYLPLVVFSFDTANVVWIVGNAILLAAGLTVLLKGKSLPCIALSLSATAFFLPIQCDFMLGQTNTLLLFLFVLFVLLLQRGNEYGASAVFALLVHIKLIPAIFLLYFLKKRRIRFIALSLLFIALLSLLPLMLLGTDTLSSFVKTVMPAISSGNYHYLNQSITGFIGRLFYMKGSLELTEGLNGMPDSRAGHVAGLVSVLILLGLLMLTRREYRGNCLFESNEISLYLLTMLLISPVTWLHSFTLTLIPYFTLISDLLQHGVRKNRFLGALLLICFVATNFLPLYRTVILVDLKFFVLAVLWTVFAVRLWRERRFLPGQCAA